MATKTITRGPAIGRPRRQPRVSVPTVPRLREDPEYKRFLAKLDEIGALRSRIALELAGLAFAQAEREAAMAKAKADPAGALDAQIADALAAPADSHRLEVLRARDAKLGLAEGAAREQLRRVAEERSRAAIAIAAPALVEIHRRQLAALETIEECCADLQAIRATLAAQGLNVNAAFKAESMPHRWLQLRARDIDKALARLGG